MRLGNVGRIQHDNALALIAGFHDEALRFVIIAWPRKRFAAVLVRLRYVASIKRKASAPILLVARHRMHVVPLIGHREDGLSHFDIVEWRVQMIEPHGPDRAGPRSNRDIAVARECSLRVVRHVFPGIDLAGAQRLRRSECLRNIEPFDAIDFYHFAA